MWIVEGEAFEAISAANSDQHLRFFSLPASFFLSGI